MFVHARRISYPIALGLVCTLSIAPAMVYASVFSRTAKTVGAGTNSALAETRASATQKMALSAPSIGPSIVLGEKKVVTDIVMNDTVIAPSMGPLGSALDVADLPESTEVITYTVHKGDTVATVAKMFDVTKATIMAANDLTPGQGLKEGIVLTILPVSGREHTVKKGDTIASIAKKYKVAVDDIVFFNDIGEGEKLSIGEVIIIPDPDFDTLPAIPVTVKKSSGSNGVSSGTSVKAPSFRDPSKPDLGNAILRPVDLGASHLTQFAHGWNRSGVDIGAPTGTPIKAAYHGTVVVATEVGYNGGYGKYVVIDHDIEGQTVRTIYGHMHSVSVSAGQSVSRGQTIGTVGSTGNSTGPHLHFEVRGALNPLTKNRNYTGLGY